jgi:alpha-tubulin suppressor-like RCC1 family protein
MKTDKITLAFPRAFARMLVCIATAFAALSAAAQPSTATPVAVAASNHSLILFDNGELWGAGFNSSGQLGQGDTDNRTGRVLIATGVRATPGSIAAGSSHTVFIKTNGSLWAAGRNNNGQLGYGTTTDMSTPVQVLGPANPVKAVAAGLEHTVLLMENGDLRGMGANGRGQLGTGYTQASQTSPITIATGLTGSPNNKTIIAIAAGSDHTLFLADDGTLWATGYNYRGQLGNNSTVAVNTPVQVATGVSTAPGSIGAAGHRSYFIKADGSLWAMGDNANSMLGDGTTTHRSVPVEIVPAGSPAVTSISAATNHTMFTKADGSLWGMGSNGYGQIGQDIGGTVATPVRVLASGVGLAAAGNYASLFVKTDGILWGVGRNQYGELGDRSAPTPRPQAIQLTGGRAAVFISDNQTVTVTEFSPATLTAAAALNSTPPLTFRWVRGGTTVPGVVTAADTFSSSLPFSPATAADAGDYAVTVASAHGEDTQVYRLVVTPVGPSITAQPAACDAPAGGIARLGVSAFGSGQLTYQWSRDGEPLANGARISGADTPVLTLENVTAADAGAYTVTVANSVAPATSAAAALTVRSGFVTSVAAGYNSTVFRTHDGSAYALGEIGYAQDLTRYPAATRLLGDVDAIAAGYYLALFAKTDGSLWGIGGNGYDQCGLGLGVTALVPHPHATADVVAASTGGGCHSLFLKNDGTLWAFGQHNYTPLDGPARDESDHDTPVKIAAGVATAPGSFAAGASGCVFVKTDGTLWAAGQNERGQLGVAVSGDWEQNIRNTPFQVPGISGVKAVAMGYSHTLVLKTNGELWTLGLNESGQLGVAVTTADWDDYHSTPVLVATGVARIAAGTNHSLFVKTDGTLWAMGDNSHGQIGVSTAEHAGLASTDTPLQIASNVTAIAAGRRHSAYVTGDGRLYAFGSNEAGQLGAGVAGGHGTYIDNTRATLTGGSDAPIILAQPQSRTVVAGTNISVTFTVQAGGQAPLSYAWFRDGAPVGDITTGDTLTLNNITAADAGGYTVTVSNSHGAPATSAAAVLTILVPPSITAHPQTQTATAGDSVTLSVTAAGTAPFTYAWFKNNVLIPGATAATLTLSPVTADDTGDYKATVTNATGITATSATATLAVLPNPQALAQAFKTQAEAPGAATIIVTGALDLSFVGGVTVATGKTILGADADATLAGPLTIPADAGDIVILGVNFTTATLTINGATDVAVEHCTFTDAPVTITGAADNIAFSWNKFTATPAGSGSAMRINGAGAATRIILDHNHWGAGLKNDMPLATNACVHMFNNHLAAAGNTTATIAGDGAHLFSMGNIYEGMTDPLAKQSGGLIRHSDNQMSGNTGSTSPAPDWDTFVPAYSHITHRATGGDTAALKNLIATHAGNTAGKNSVPAPGAAATARITATVTGPAATASAAGASVPAGGGFTLAASGSGFTPSDWVWYRNHQPVTGANAATRAVTAATAADHAGAYVVAMSINAAETAWSGAFTVTVGAAVAPAAPVITAHPQSQTVTAGATVTFNVTATGENLAYQWLKNGSPVTGATSASHTITNAQQTTHAGSYSVRVTSNPGGPTVTSNTATLTVNPGGNNNNNNNNNNSGGGGGGGAPTLPFLALIVALLLRRAAASLKNK